MPEFGMMGVDWEERIDFDRMRRDRLQKTREAMEKYDVDVLFVFDLVDIRYITACRSHLAPTPSLGRAAVVLPRGGDPILCTMDVSLCRSSMPWLKPENILRRPSIRTQSGTKQWADEIKGRLGELAEGRISVDIWTKGFSDWFPQNFPKAEILDGKEILHHAKIIKTQDEIECHKIATMITEAGFQALREHLKPGIKECELLAIAWQKFTELGSEWTQCANIIVSGPSTAPYRRFTSDRVIREGDLVIVDIGGCYNGYWGDMTRTYLCGDILPTKEQIDLHQECYNVLFHACAEAVVGKTNADIAKHFNDPRENPHSDGVSGGHGAGVDPWEPPWLQQFTPDDVVPLQPGMIFSLEPYAGIPGIGGVRLENQLVVTAGKEPDIFTALSFDERLLRDIHPLDRTTGRKK